MNEGSAPLAPGVDFVKALVDVLRLKSDQPEKPQARSGPLVVVGRLYISLTLILAVSTSAAAYLDTKMPNGHPTSPAVEALRVTVLFCVVLGLVSSLLLILILAVSKPLLIFSPTELSAEAQQSLYSPRTKDEGEKGTNVSSPPVPAPGAAPAPAPAAPTTAISSENKGSG